MLSTLLWGCQSSGNTTPTPVTLAIPATFEEKFEMRNEGAKPQTLSVEVKKVDDGLQYSSVLKKNDDQGFTTDTVTTTVLMQEGTLMPLSTKIDAKLTGELPSWNLSATYQGQQLSVFATSDNGKEFTTTRRAPFAIYYDNETYMAVLRAFPLETENFAAILYLAQANGATINPYVLKVTGE